MSKKKHHKYGPSALVHMKECIRFSYDDSDKDAASEGTLLHKAWETGNLAGLTEEQKIAVVSATDYLESVKATLGGPDNWLVFRELAIKLEGLTFGTADAVLFHKHKPVIHVLDGKFTRVPRDYRFQVEVYAAGIVEKLRNARPKEVTWDRNALHSPEAGVHMHVLAPRIGDIDTWSSKDPIGFLRDIRKQVEELYEAQQNPFTPPTPGELCSKCKWAAECPALGRVAVRVAKKGGLPLPEEFRPENMIDPRDRAIAQVAAGMVIKWGTAVKKYNAEYAANGNPDGIPGYRLVARSNGISVPKEYTPDAIEAISQKTGLGLPFVLESCTITLGHLSSRLSKTLGVTEGEAKELIREALGDMATESVSQFLQKSKRISDTAMLQLIEAAD